MAKTGLIEDFNSSSAGLSRLASNFRKAGDLSLNATTDHEKELEDKDLSAAIRALMGTGDADDIGRIERVHFNEAAGDDPKKKKRNAQALDDLIYQQTLLESLQKDFDEFNRLAQELADIREKIRLLEEELIEKYGEDFFNDIAGKYLDKKTLERRMGESEADYERRIRQELMEKDIDDPTEKAWLEAKDKEEQKLKELKEVYERIQQKMHALEEENALLSNRLGQLEKFGSDLERISKMKDPKDQGVALEILISNNPSLSREDLDLNKDGEVTLEEAQTVTQRNLVETTEEKRESDEALEAAKTQAGKIEEQAKEIRLNDKNIVPQNSEFSAEEGFDALGISDDTLSKQNQEFNKIASGAEAAQNKTVPEPKLQNQGNIPPTLIS